MLSPTRRAPSWLGTYDERHEPDAIQRVPAQLARRAADHHQPLTASAHGDHHSAAGGDLALELRGNLARAGGNVYRVVRCVRCVPGRSVADSMALRIAVPQPGSFVSITTTPSSRIKARVLPPPPIST